MSNVKFTARSALNEATLDHNGVQLKELIDVQLLSLAVNTEQLNAASQQLQSSVGVQWPDIGRSTSNANTRCLGLQAEQVFLMTRSTSDTDLAQQVQELSKSAFVTDQSDSWVTVQVSGENRRAMLERICPIDLDESAFTDGAVSRTAMEHLSVIIFRDFDSFVLLSPRSSSNSFWHALTVSTHNL